MQHKRQISPKHPNTAQGSTALCSNPHRDMNLTNSVLLTFWTQQFLLWEVVQYTVGCLTAFLAFTHQMPVATPNDDNKKCLQTRQMLPWGQNHSHLGSTDTDYNYAVTSRTNKTRSPRGRAQPLATFIHPNMWHRPEVPV